MAHRTAGRTRASGHRSRRAVRDRHRHRHRGPTTSAETAPQPAGVHVDIDREEISNVSAPAEPPKGPTATQVGMRAVDPRGGWRWAVIVAATLLVVLDAPIVNIALPHAKSALHISRDVSLGQAETGRVITAAALIMISVFGAFVLDGDRIIAEFGIGLAVAIAIGAFLLAHRARPRADARVQAGELVAPRLAGSADAPPVRRTVPSRSAGGRCAGRCGTPRPPATSAARPAGRAPSRRARRPAPSRGRRRSPRCPRRPRTPAPGQRRPPHWPWPTTARPHGRRPTLTPRWPRSRIRRRRHRPRRLCSRSHDPDSGSSRRESRRPGPTVSTGSPTSGSHVAPEHGVARRLWMWLAWC